MPSYLRDASPRGCIIGNAGLGGVGTMLIVIVVPWNYFLELFWGAVP